MNIFTSKHISKSFPIFLSTLVGLGFILIKSNSTLAQTEVPIKQIVLNIGEKNGLIRAAFIVPDQDTTIPAYGGRLTRYDVHIAKMVEITRYECIRSRQSNTEFRGHYWVYRAGNGEINMGNFEIDCALAIELSAGYGLGNAESTPITYYRAHTTVDIPILNITGDKVDNWIQFTTNFKPVSYDEL